MLFNGRQAKKLEAQRRKTLSAIRAERLLFENMMQRARQNGGHPDEEFSADVLARLAEIEQRANHETDAGELDELIGDAEQQGQLRAYICPIREVSDEGSLIIDLMREWGVPKSVISGLRSSLGQKLADAAKDPDAARSALRALFDEQDSWSSHTDDYEETMKKYAWRLFFATIILTLGAIIALRFPPTWSLIAVLCAGAGGACVSVLNKMPRLDVALSEELDSYTRRIYARVAVGFTASLIGSAFFGWGILPIAIHGETFTDIFNSCTTLPFSSCTALRGLMFIAIPMLLGFSERALASFERRMFGDARQTMKGATEKDN